MNKLLLPAFLLVSFTMSLSAENNATSKTKVNADVNSSSKSIRVEKKIQEQMEKEKKYAKEKTFYQGDDYNLSAVEVDPESLSSVPIIEPQYDFDMDDVYSDIQ